MRGRSLSIGTVGRVAGFAMVAAAIVAASFHFRHEDVSVEAPSGAVVASVPGDRLARELARCRSIGMAAKDDVACATAWAENRRRFFT